MGGRTGAGPGHRAPRLCNRMHTGGQWAAFLAGQDPALQARLRDSRERAGDDHHRAMARAHPMARRVVEPQRPARLTGAQLHLFAMSLERPTERPAP
jgi:hypothetical protein